MWYPLFTEGVTIVRSGRGRPVQGAEAKSIEVKIRFEPYLLAQIDAACKSLRMTRSAFIRYASEQLIKAVKQYRPY